LIRLDDLIPKQDVKGADVNCRWVRPRQHKQQTQQRTSKMQRRRVAANAVGYAMHRSGSHDAVIRVYDDAGNMLETHEHAGDFKGW
jgi:hypothetical protein